MEDTILTLHGITKQYPGVTALDDVSLSFRKGEVHALLGENGAGKSTLIKIISGAVVPDAGSVTIDGKSFSRLEPLMAKQNGVEVIYQEFNLMDTLSVAENICIGERNGRLVDYKAMRKKAQSLFASMGVSVPVDEQVCNLPASQQQLVEIAKAISKQAKILIMDEPSAPLSVSEVVKLFDIVRLLKQNGVTIIYISHRLDEIFEISDRVSIMRDGKYISTLETKSTNRQDLIRLMVGRELSESYPVKHGEPGEKALELRSVYGNGDQDISFTVRKGEIVGIAGLVGAGRTELARLIAGADRRDSGEILVNGKPVHIRLPSDAIRNGIGLIPEDRKQQGVFLEKSVIWNSTIANLRKLRKGIVIDRKLEKQQAKHYISLFDIKTPSVDQLVRNLSGGNQQKVALAKTLATQSDILIFDEPTRGIDVAAKQEIYQLMCRLADEGKAILMISSDMPEILGMSDRIIVISHGRITGELSKNEFSQVRILELASEQIMEAKSV